MPEVSAKTRRLLPGAPLLLSARNPITEKVTSLKGKYPLLYSPGVVQGLVRLWFLGFWLRKLLLRL